MQVETPPQTHADAAEAARLKWHRDLAAVLRTLHDRGAFRQDWFSRLSGNAGSLFYVPLLLLLQSQWHLVAASVAGILLALLLHGRLLLRPLQRRVEHSGVAEALLHGDPEMLAGHATAGDSFESLSARLAQVAQQAQHRAVFPWLYRLQLATLLLAGLLALSWFLLATTLTGFSIHALAHPAARWLGIAGAGALMLCLALVQLAEHTAAQHCYLMLSQGVAAGLGVPLEELLSPHRPPVERIAQRLGVAHTLRGGEVILWALLFLLGILTPLLWLNAAFDDGPAWLVAVSLLALNVGGGVWSLHEAARYRRDVRRRLAASDLPLRLALGQVELPRAPVLKLARERSELEQAAQAAANRLPREIGLRTPHLSPRFSLSYYAGALAALLWLQAGLRSEGLLSPYIEDLWGMAFSALPLLLFPLLAHAYKRTIHAEELVRLLRERQTG